MSQGRAEGGFDADLFHQWREDQGRGLVRGIRQKDQAAAEELIVSVPAGWNSHGLITLAKALGKARARSCPPAPASPFPRAMSRTERLAPTPTLHSMVLSRKGVSRPANKKSCP